jgi:hypothetical protein
MLGFWVNHWNPLLSSKEIHSISGLRDALSVNSPQAPLPGGRGNNSKTHGKKKDVDLHTAK